MPSGNTSPNVFISYARKDDEPFVRQLHQDLVKNGIYVWWDRTAMESRGNTFLQEIRDAITDIDRVILVVGPHAVSSAYVEVEWKYALELCKVVVPILRKVHSDKDDHSSDFKIVPKDLSSFHCPDFRDDSKYHNTLKELIRILHSEIPALADVSMVDRLPSNFQSRPLLQQQLTETMLKDLLKPEVINPSSRLVSLCGMGGVGKSVLASSFARLCSVRRAFNDGIFWLHFGNTGISKEATDLSNMHKLTNAISDNKAPSVVDLEKAKQLISELLKEKKCLLILDDIWDVSSASHFLDVIGKRVRILITTRDLSIAVNLGQVNIKVDVLDLQSSIELFSMWVNIPSSELPDISKELVKECGYLPLAISIVGAMLRGRPTNRWFDILTRLQKADLQKIQSQFPNYPYPNLYKTIEVSVTELDQKTRDCYLKFAVFYDHNNIPESVFETLLLSENFDILDIHDVLDLLVQHSLLQQTSQKVYSLHDLQYDFLLCQWVNNSEPHELLIEAYRKKYPLGWHTGHTDNYYFEHLPEHLYRANLIDELSDLLLNPVWLFEKNLKANVQKVIQDFEITPLSEAHKIIKDCLLLSAHIISLYPQEFFGQILARLQEINLDEHNDFKNNIEINAVKPWLKPLLTSIAKPGGAIIRTIQSPSSYDHLMEVIPNSSIAITTSYHGKSITDRNEYFQFWDLENGRAVNKINGEQGYITCFFLNHNQGKIYAIGKDERLCIYELGDQKLREEVILPIRPFGILPLNNDSEILIIGYETVHKFNWKDKLIELIFEIPKEKVRIGEYLIDLKSELLAIVDWKGLISVIDVRSKKLSWQKPDFKEYGASICVDSQGKYLFAVNNAQEVEVVDLKTGVLLKKLPGRNYPITALSVSKDGKYVFVGMNDGMLEIRSMIEPNNTFCHLSHENRITSIKNLDDARKIITYSMDNTLKVWNIENLSKVEKSKPHLQDVSKVVGCIKQNIAISLSGDASILYWDLESNRVIKKTTTEDWIQDAFVLEDESLLITAESGGKLKWWNIQDGELLATRDNRVDTYHALTYSKKRRLIISSWYIDDLQDHLYGLEIWDIDTKKLLGSNMDDMGSRSPLHAHQLDYDEDLNLGLSPHAYGGGISFWKIENNKPFLVKVIKGGGVNSAIFIPKNKQALISRSEGELQFWDVSQEIKLKNSIYLEHNINKMAINKDQSMLILCSKINVFLIHVDSNEILCQFSIENKITCCAFVANDTEIMIGDTNGGVNIFSIEV